jgi:hypothetical protein
MTDDEFALELELEHLEAELATDPHLWDERRRGTVAGAFAVSVAVPSLRPRALALLQVHAPAWIAQAPQVMALRLQPPNWTAYRHLRAIQEALAERYFSCSWGELMRWCAGAPAAELPPPAPIPAMDPAWCAASEEPLPWHTAVAALATSLPVLASLDSIAVRFAAERPRAELDGGRVLLTLRDDRDTPRAWFHLLHELGHAITLALSPTALPRAVDEAVASWLARHLERPGSLALPAHAFAEPLHRQERARRVAVATALGHLEAAVAVAAGDASENRTLPWALWHDAGAQPAYLAAEALAEQWCKDGLALADLPRALAAARDEARALPPPFSTIRP